MKRRYHIRAPSFINLTAMEQMCLGQKVADVVVVLGSAVIDAEFEQVTNHVGPGDPVFGRLKIELAE